MKKFKIDFSFILFLLVIFFSPKQYLILQLLICLVLHELGHLLMLLVVRYPIEQLKLSVFGFSLTLKHSKVSFLKDLAVYSGGILVNLICYIIIPNEEIRQIHLALLILNSIPVYPLDGFNILKTILFYFVPHFHSLWIGGILGVVGSISLLACSIFLKWDLFLIFSFTYLVIENILFLNRISVLQNLFLLKKELYLDSYPLRTLHFHDNILNYLYQYHQIELVIGDKKFKEKDLLEMKKM